VCLVVNGPAVAGVVHQSITGMCQRNQAAQLGLCRSLIQSCIRIAAFTHHHLGPSRPG